MNAATDTAMVDPLRDDEAMRILVVDDDEQTASVLAIRSEFADAPVA